MKRKSKEQLLTSWNQRSLTDKLTLVGAGIAIVLSGVVFLSLLYYVIVVAKGYYHSDCTDTILWAEAALDAGALMNPDFNYACLLPFGGQLLMMPFVAMFGFGMKAQIIGMTLFYLIFTAALVWLFYQMGWSPSWVVAGSALVLLVASGSEKMREIFWGHIIYYSLGLLFTFVGMALLLAIEKEKEIPWVKLTLFFVWTMLCSMNGIQALTIYGLPVLAALVAERFFDTKTSFRWKDNVNRYLSIGSMCLAILTGLCLGEAVNGDIVAGYAEGYSGFSEPSTWVDNFFLMFPEMMELVGLRIKPDMLLYSMDGIFNLLRVVFVLIIWVVPVIMAILYRKFKEPAYRIFFWSHCALSVLVGLGWTVGELNSASWRLTPVVISSMILCVMLLRWIWAESNWKRLIFMLGIPVVLVCMVTMRDIYKLKPQSNANKNLTDLANYLEQEHLEYGYATFWQAGIVTMMTDSKVKVRTIALEDWGYRPRHYQTNEKWFEEVPEQSEYFVVLTSGEMADYYENTEYSYPLADEIRECAGFSILIYYENPLESE